VSDAAWFTVIGNALLPLAGGGLLGVVLENRRSAAKAEAEATRTTAETKDMEWARFQREIERLDKKSAAQDHRIDQLEKEVRECHEERDREREERTREREEDMRDRVKLEGEVAKLRGIIDGKGQVAQMASAIVAADRLEGRQIKRGDK
jgi:predicted  nucleic acid-binding Zn-ribbon protein